jgi:hypothetical protein
MPIYGEFLVCNDLPLGGLGSREAGASVRSRWIQSSPGLTIFAQHGLSTGTVAIVTTGHNGFSRGFTVSPANPAGGQTVRFRALTTVGNKPAINYLWEFGDGSTGSGPRPTTHTSGRAPSR